MGSIVYFVLLLACPVAMMFMMRGMMGGRKVPEITAEQQRIVDLEDEVAVLRGKVVHLASTDVTRDVAHTAPRQPPS